MKTIKVCLYGLDNSLHAEGELALKILDKVSFVERNKRIYRFANFSDNLAKFEECAQPYTITEF